MEGWARVGYSKAVVVWQLQKEYNKNQTSRRGIWAICCPPLAKLTRKIYYKNPEKNRRKTLHNFFNQVSNEMEKFSLCTSFCFYFYRQPNDKFICYLADFHEQLLHTLHTDTTALNTHKHTHTHNDSGTVVNMVFVAWFLAHAHSARNDVGCWLRAKLAKSVRDRPTKQPTNQPTAMIESRLCGSKKFSGE